MGLDQSGLPRGSPWDCRMLLTLTPETAPPKVGKCAIHGVSEQVMKAMVLGTSGKSFTLLGG